MVTEEQVRQWAREEFDKRDAEKIAAKQATCEHLVSGTIKDSILTCDQCDKVLTPEDEWYPESRAAIEERYTQFTKEHPEAVK